MAHQDLNLWIRMNPLTNIKLSGNINTCNFNSYNTLALGTSNKTISVWEWTEEGYVEASYSPLLHDHDYSIISVVFSVDGRTLATTSTDGMTYLWNIKSGALKASIVQSFGGGVRDTAMTKNLLGSVTDDGYIFLWSLENYQLHRYWVGHEPCINCLAFTPDDYLAATGDSEGTFKLWYVERATSNICMADTLIGHVEKDAHSESVLSVAFSPNHYTEIGTKDYQMCSGGDDHKVRLWSVCVMDETGAAKLPVSPSVTVRLIRVYEGHLSSITCVRFSPDGQFIGSTSLDGSIRIWQVSTEQCVQNIYDCDHSIFCCAFSPTVGFFAAGSYSKSINVWQVVEHEVPVIEYEHVEADEDYEKKETERRFFKILDILKCNSNVNSVDLNSMFDLVIGGSDKMVRIHKLRLGKHEETPSVVLKNHTYSVVNVEFSRCNQFLVTTSIDGTNITWSCNCLLPRDLRKISQFQLSSQGGRVARFSPSSELLAVGGNDGKAYLWCMNKNCINHCYLGHMESINCLSWTPDGEYIATGCAAGNVKIWATNPASPARCIIENVHDLGVTSLDFSHMSTKSKDKNGKPIRVYRFATGGHDSFVRVWKIWPVNELMVEYKEEFNLKGHGGTITQVCFSNKPSNLLASTASDRTARIWNMQSGQSLNVLHQHKSQVTCCAFSPDTSLFVTGSLDNTVIVWEVPQAMQTSSNSFRERDLLTKDEASGVEVEKDLEGLKLDDVTLSLEDLVSTFKRNSTVVPEHMLCPITQQIMVDPVKCEDGFSYEKHAILSWLQNGRNTSPMTNVPFVSTTFAPNLIPNLILKMEIKKFLLKHSNPDPPTAT